MQWAEPADGALSGRYVAVEPDGSPLRPSRLNEMFEHYTKATGLPRIRLHDLRHSAISYLLEQGVPVPTVAAFAGHDPAMTLRVYSHASDAGLKAAAEHFSALRRGRL
nr:tyrosine-type recombinase/integrase [Humibacter albus]